MSTSLPPAVLHDDGMRRVAEKIEEAGYLVVARADVHALRAAADKVLRFTPGVEGCALHGVREHGHQGGSPAPTPMSKPCKTCGVVNGHRIGCRRSIARAALIKAVIDWHRASHRGEFETCNERECYACHPSVLPG